MARSTSNPLITPLLGGLAAALVVGPLAAVGQAQTLPSPPDPATAPSAEADDAPRFTCQMHEGQYTVMYSPTSQAGQAYPWAVPEDMGSAWPAQRRCATISNRLEQYRPDGLLALETAVENGYNTVCVTTETVPGCRIVFTVPPGQDAMATRDRVFDNLTLADRGDSTQGVTTFTGGSSDILNQIGNILGLPNAASPSRRTSGIDLKPFLSPADGGTGARLNGSSPAGRSLNPNVFR